MSAFVSRFLTVIIGLALFQVAAVAQGPLQNGDNASGAIAVAGEIDTWTFDASAGDAISLGIGEVNRQ